MSGSAIRRIVVGVDGSEGSAAALGWVSRLAAALDAEVVAVHAFQLPLLAPPPLGAAMAGAQHQVPYDDSWQGSIRRLFEAEWCAPLARAGVRWRTVLEEGPAGRVLLEVAERQVADLLVIGHRGLGSLAELVAGSVGQHVVHRARLPVVVVPGPSGRDGTT